MGRHGSDKGNVIAEKAWHNYTIVYYELFRERKDEPLRVFEMGIGTNNTALPSNMGPDGRPGASLFGWREFFPNAAVFGADIDRDILFYCDQRSSEAIQAMWAQPELAEGFDIIVEDGLHSFDANKCFLENSLYKLKAGGWYIIEDVARPELGVFETQVALWMSMYAGYTFEIRKIANPNNSYDNTVVIVHRVF